MVREAFQTKKRGNFGQGPIRGGEGRQKNKKVKSFSWGKVQNSSYEDPKTYFIN